MGGEGKGYLSMHDMHAECGGHRDPCYRKGGAQPCARHSQQLPSALACVPRPSFLAQMHAKDPKQACHPHAQHSREGILRGQLYTCRAPTWDVRMGLKNEKGVMIMLESL